MGRAIAGKTIYPRRHAFNLDLVMDTSRFHGIHPILYAFFMMSSIDAFVCYGKRITARRLGIAEVLDRAPCQRPTEFGLLMAERLAAGLPAF